MSNQQQITAADYRKLNGLDKKPAQKESMSAEEWRNMMRKKKNKPAEKNKGEIRMMLNLARIEFIEEHKFHPERKWRFDFAIPVHKIAIEYEGIHSKKSRHTTQSGYQKDAEKYNAAAMEGWTVLRYTAKTYTRVIDDVRGLLNKLDKGICMEKNCTDKATKDYNGHGHWVCQYHYKKLSDNFDEEYA